MRIKTFSSTLNPSHQSIVRTDSKMVKTPNIKKNIAQQNSSYNHRIYPQKKLQSCKLQNVESLKQTY